MKKIKVPLKKTGVVLLSLCFALHASAQVGEGRSDLAFGVNDGVALNKISCNPTINQTWKPGITLGGTIRYTCEKYFSCICALQAEINYTQMGWKEKIEESTDTYERTINYIQIPLLARLGFGREMRGAMGYLVLGPQIGFCLNDKTKKNEWTDPTNPIRPNNIIDQYSLNIQNKFDYGITGGLGLEISTSIGHFMAEGRYYFGLSDIFKNGKADTFGRSAHGAIIAKITYLFDVIKTKGVVRK